jgi:hypothetical protein
MYRQACDFVGVQHLDAQRLQALGAGHGTGNRAGNLVLDGGQRIDEFVDRRARADTDDFAGHHIGQGSLPDQGFEFILGKGGSRGRHEGKSR